jgi:hypothetical protein
MGHDLALTSAHHEERVEAAKSLSCIDISLARPGPEDVWN